MEPQNQNPAEPQTTTPAPPQATTQTPPQTTSKCPFCSAQITPDLNFCPVCGKQLKEPPFNISIGKQIGLYLLSILLPPLGLWPGPGIKYLFKKDNNAKKVGIIIVILTIIGTVITIWASVGILNSVNKTIDLQLNSLQGY